MTVDEPSREASARRPGDPFGDAVFEGQPGLPSSDGSGPRKQASDEPAGGEERSPKGSPGRRAPLRVND
jgi:hypothetical protein